MCSPFTTSFRLFTELFAYHSAFRALSENQNAFFAELQADGTYMMLVKKYFRAAPRYLPGFFSGMPGADK